MGREAFMAERIRITAGGVTEEFDRGTCLYEAAKKFQKHYPYDIILGMQGSRLLEMHHRIDTDMEVSFITTADRLGRKTYWRGMKLLLLRAAMTVIGREKLKRLWVDFSLGNSLFCRLEWMDGIEEELTEELLLKVEKEMEELVRNDLRIQKETISTNDAIALFEKHGMYDKQKLFHYRRVSRTNIYELDGIQDYFYGYMPYSTGVLKYFHLEKYEDGFMLELPSSEEPKVPAATPAWKKLFHTMKASGDWGRLLEVETVGDLNDVIARGEITDLILVQEAMMERRISEIAADIVKSRDHRIVMIAGPSSSGKTTFSHRLSIELRAHGLKPHPIPVDDYFVNREDTPLDENGNYNFECLEAIDIGLFNENMSDLLAGKKVELPVFNFKTGHREYKGNFKQLGKNDILVIEGIHGLNDKLSYALPKESKYKIYISALTQLNVDEHNRIPTTDGRLLRRIVRDARTRGTSALGTIHMWNSVRRGEEKYIFPFQEESNAMFNSALIYELAVLKLYAEPLLFGIERGCPEYLEAKRLLKFLDYFVGIKSEDIPNNSIVREFIGGSIFHV